MKAGLAVELNLLLIIFLLIKTDRNREKILGFLFVRMEGLEPPRLAAPDPKSGSATNYDTCANLS